MTERPSSAPISARREQLLRRRAHWRHTRRLTIGLLIIWFATGFGTIFFARELYQLTLFSWPFSFYMAAQGSLLIYLALIGYYAWRMRQLDRQWRHAERT
ncbi:MAG: DUF4212 domain-containing protein [Pseudomonadota bacterium]